MQEKVEANADELLKMIMNTLPKAEVPLKIKIFSWKLFQDRLPARFQQFKRGIVQNLHDNIMPNKTLGNAFFDLRQWF